MASQREHVITPSRVAATINLVIATICLLLTWVPVEDPHRWVMFIVRFLLIVLFVTFLNLAKEEFRAAADIDRAEKLAQRTRKDLR